MATLEKIREKQGLLFGVIIVALFLFIITLAGNPFESCQRQGGDATVIKAGNVSISNQEFTEYKRPYDQRGNQQVDQQELNQQLLQSALAEKLLTKECEKLGIKVPDAYIAQVIELTRPAMYQQLAQAFGTPSAAQIANIITHPETMNLSRAQLDEWAHEMGYLSMANVWQSIEQQAETQMQSYIFTNLVDGLFQANKLDAKAMYDDNYNTRDVAYVATPLAAVTEQFTPTDAELKAKWEELKPIFKLDQETRLVDYVVVNITPSQADYEAADQLVAANEEALQSQSGPEGIALVSGMELRPLTAPISTLKKDPSFAAIPDSVIREGGVYKFPRISDSYSLIRFENVYMQVDSVNFSLFQAMSAQEADSLVNGLNAGTLKFADMVAANPQMCIDSIWEQIGNTSEAKARAKINGYIARYDAGDRNVFVDTLVGNGQTVYRIGRINSHKPAVKTADMSYFYFDVAPSTETVTQLRNDLSNFIASYNTAETFAAAADSLYRFNHATSQVTASSAHINDDVTGMRRSAPVKDSRHAVKWAMNAKKGDVSRIFDDNPQVLLVAAVRDVYDSDYIPYNSELLAEQIKQMVIADKKAEKLGAQYQPQASSLEALATAMDTQVMHDNNFTLGANSLGMLRDMTNTINYNLMGQAAGAKSGKVYGPVHEANNVVFFTVTDNPQSTREINDGDYRKFKQTFGITKAIDILEPQTMLPLLLGDRKVQNKLLDLEYNDDAK